MTQPPRPDAVPDRTFAGVRVTGAAICERQGSPRHFHPSIGGRPPRAREWELITPRSFRARRAAELPARRAAIPAVLMEAPAERTHCKTVGRRPNGGLK